MWLLFILTFTDGCHADGPFARYDPNGRIASYCADWGDDGYLRDVVDRETITGFRSEESCEAEGRRRWHESGYATAARCSRMDRP